MALIEVPGGEVAAVVTHLEMRARPPSLVVPEGPLTLARWHDPPLADYRALFAAVGGPWLWFSRLARPDSELAAILAPPSLELFAARREDRAVGLLELDFSQAGECEIGFFGLVPDLTGHGHGRWLMTNALATAWRPGIERVWLHTCTLDHPAALGFYRKQGFTPYRRQVETFPDPRLTGLLPPEAAPQVPLLNRA